MNREAILLPVLAMVVLTAVVWALMGAARVREARSKRIHPQAVKTRAQSSTAFVDAAARSDNYHNLFEMPVLFYVLALALYATGLADFFYAVLAWIYVLLRYAHSYIHITYNRVMHRFAAFAASTVVLWVMWARFGVQIIGRAFANG
jgi:hypothetical protein